MGPVGVMGYAPAPMNRHPSVRPRALRSQVKKFSLLSSPALRLSFLGGLALLGGCSGSRAFEKSLDEMWQWDGGAEASAVLTSIASAKYPPTVPAAVGVTGRGLVGRTLPDGALWKYEGTVDVLPTLVADVVLFSGDGKVTMLDLKTGNPRFSIDVSGRRLEGAGYDGEHAALLLVDTDDARQDQILIVGPRGERVTSAMATARLGTPAVVQGVGLVPYSGQYVGAIDIATRQHIGRVLLRDGVHTVKTEGGQALVYGAGATLLDTQVTSSPDSHSLKLKPLEFPGEPVWPVDGSKPRPPRATPVGLYALPVKQEGRLRFSEGAYLATYFEILVGVDHGTNQVRFAAHLPRPVAGGMMGPKGATLCLENGSIVRVSMKQGATSPYGSLETRLRACVVNGVQGEAPLGERPPLLQQIVETIVETGPDMLAMQRLLLTELASRSGPETTEALLNVAQDPLVSVDLARKAATFLSERTEGGAQMVAALVAGAPQTAGESAQEEPPVDSLDQGENRPLSARRPNRRPPPVGALATALTRLKPPGAIEALAPFLLEPDLSPENALSLMVAMQSLGGPEQIPEVSAFFASYKNTGGEEALVEALVMAAVFLDEHLDAAGQKELRRQIAQPLTQPSLQKKLEAKLRSLSDQAPSDEASPPEKAR